MVSHIKMQCAILFLFPISLQFGQQIGVNWVQSESAAKQKVFDATQADFEWTIDPFRVWGGVVSYVTSRKLINLSSFQDNWIEQCPEEPSRRNWRVLTAGPFPSNSTCAIRKPIQNTFFLPISRVDFDQQSIQKSNSSPHCEFVAFWIKTILQPANRSSGLIINWQSNERFCVPVARIKILIIAPSGEPSVHNKSP